MLTAAITATIVALCAFFGVHLSIAQIGGLLIGVKIVVVLGIFGLTAVMVRSKNDKAAAATPLNAAESVDGES